MESRSEIVQKLLYVAEHKEQCFDFETQVWLEKYVQRNHEPINFSEAAFLVYSAAKIYGHKVDYLEQMLYEFNRRSAADFKATAKGTQHAAGDGDAPNGKNNASKIKEKAAEKEKEKMLKRQKRLLKMTNKIEFNPKQFTTAAKTQISLNIHEQRTDLDDDDYEQLRMKNVFPRINILQSNLQNNSSFYDNLGVVEKNCDNLDSLRDYRIFMDTIDEPMHLEIVRGDGQTSTIATALKNRGNEKHFNAYLSADHIKAKYGIEMPDNSDYLNMLKYGEEIERLNLRKLTIEQLGQLKVGTYLNNILHGNQQDCIIPEADSGMGESICDSTNEQSTVADSSLNTTATSNMSEPGSDQSMSDPSSDHSMSDPSSDHSVSDPSSDHSLSDQSTSEPNLAMECSETPELMETTNADDSGVLDVSQLSESFNGKFGDLRHSLDDGLGASLLSSPVQMGDLDPYERNMLNPVVEVHDLFFPVKSEMSNEFTADLKDPSMDVLDPKEVKIAAPLLRYNIFQIPEKLLRKVKLFQLTNDFDLWILARKRKAGCTDDLAPRGKMLKLSSGAFVHVDPNSDDEELLGFDPEMIMRLQRRISIAQSPAPILNRANSSDSGINDKNTTVAEDELNADGTLNATEQSTLNISGEHQTGNSTEICNDTFGASADLSDIDQMLNSTENQTLNATTQASDASTTGNIELIPPELVSTLNDDNTDGNYEDEIRLGKYLSPETESDKIPSTKQYHFYPKITRIDNERIEEDNRNEDMRDMVERVSKWHENLRPVLQHSEARNNFNIHALGTDIINLFPEEKPEHEISFTNVMENRDQTYTARYFLSLLLLANTKNVKINVKHPEQNGKVLCSKDDLKIKLLSRTRHMDEVNKINEHLDDSSIAVAGSSKKFMSNIDHSEPTKLIGKKRKHHH